MQKTLRSSWLTGLCLAGLSFLSAQSFAATPPGTSLVNVATVEHTVSPSPGAPVVSTDSNPVVTQVLAPAVLSVTKSSDPTGTVPPGTLVTYRLLVVNPAATELTDVRIVDPLDAWLQSPGSISDGAIPDQAGSGTIDVAGAYDSLAHAITWTAAVVPANARLELSFTATIDPLTPDDAIVRNVTTQTSVQDPIGTQSNEVSLSVVSPPLTLSKVASRSRAEVGDPVGYEIVLANTSAGLDLSAVTITDVLPEGFRYMERSARLDGQAIPEPAGAPPGTGQLVFPLPDLPAGTSARLTYVAVPTALAEGRDGVNVARAAATTPAGAPVAAGPAQARVRVAGSFLSSDSVVVGRVFVDDNRNGLFDEGEVGVPMARVYLEDGTFVFTDVVGKYHIEGVRAGLHVLKIDPSTMPRGLGSFASWSRSSGGRGTQFVDVGADQLFKSNVATGGWGLWIARLSAHGIYLKGDERKDVEFPPLLASAVFEEGELSIRRSASPIVDAYAALIRERGGKLISLEVRPSFYPLADEEIMQARADRLYEELRRTVMAEVRPTSRPGSPVAKGDGAPPDPATAPAGDAGPASAQSAPAQAGRSSLPDLDLLQARVREMDPEPAVLMPPEGAVVAAGAATVEVKLPAGLVPKLSVNGEEIAADKIAVRMETETTHVAFFRYLGVPFKEGRNSIVLEGYDSWGNARVWVERIVSRVGPPRVVSLRPDDATLKADGRTPPEVRIDIVDAQGLPVGDGTLVTVEVDQGDILGQDAVPDQEGFQVETVGGSARVRLEPDSDARQRTVRAISGEITQETTFSLLPELRQWILAGVGDASVGHRGMGSGDDLADLLDEDSADPAGRLALFARGRLFDASLLTFAYDSARERDRDQVFRSLAPDRFFPIYGDSGRQGYEVEGQGKLSLRLDQPRSSMRLGDFTTALSGGDLLRYDRALTGGAGRVELSGLSLQSFGARTRQTQIRDDLPGAGISGPYRLTRRPVIVNSERVVLETRERFHEERIVSTREMSRFSDYDVDYDTGVIFFKQPVPFQDDDFNPVVVVVLYETLDGDDEDTVAGGRVGYRFGETAEIGTSYVTERRDGGAFNLRGADFRVKHGFGRGTLDLGGELAMTDSAAGDAAGAVSFKAAGTLGKSVGLSGYYRHVSSGYSNPSRTGINDVGTVRWGLDGKADLADGSLLKGEFFEQKDELRDQERRVGALDWEKPIGPVKARSGFKDVRTLGALTGRPQSSRLLSAGASMKLGDKLEGLIARQQVVQGEGTSEYPTRTTLGLSSKISESITGFARQEFDQSELGRASRTVVGLESRLTRNTVMESRYRIEDALAGSRGSAQLGLRSRVPLNQDWLSDASLERVVATQGTGTADFTSLGVGLEYLPARVKFTTRYELRLGEIEDRHVFTTGGATRLTDALSLFSRQRLFLVNPDSAGARLDGDGLLGLAYRPLRDDRLNFLVKLQGVKGEGIEGAGSPKARSYLGITEVNYEPAPRLHLLTRFALKDSRDRFDTEAFSSRTWLTEARGLVDVGSRFNLGLTLRRMRQVATATSVSGVGLEAGYQMMRDTWLVVGYNLTGFSADGFGDDDRRSAGPFMSLRFKFDEESLIGLSKRLRSDDGVAP